MENEKFTNGQIITSWVLIIMIIFIAAFFIYIGFYSQFSASQTLTLDGSQYTANYTFYNHPRFNSQTCVITSLVSYTSVNGSLIYRNLSGNATALQYFNGQLQRNCTYR